MRIVIDTNIIASAIFFGGRPKALIEHLVKRDLEASVSQEIIDEYRETVDELCSRFPLRPPTIPLTEILSTMQVIEPVTKISVCRDPDDDKFISCAVDAKCIYIVSGDKDLLSLKSYGNIQILTVAECLSIIEDTINPPL